MVNEKKSIVIVQEQTSSQNTVIENKFAYFWVTFKNGEFAKTGQKQRL